MLTNEPSLCRAPALRGKTRCRLHGGWSPGAPRGEKHPNFKHGKRTIETREIRKAVRAWVKGAEVLTATLMSKAGLKPVRAIRRKAHVRRALAELKAAAKAKETTK